MHFGPSRPQFESLMTLDEASRCLVAYKGGFGDSAAFGQFGVKNHPGKKVSKCVWGYFGWVLMRFPGGFDAFWAL